MGGTIVVSQKSESKSGVLRRVDVSRTASWFGGCGKRMTELRSNTRKIKTLVTQNYPFLKKIKSDITYWCPWISQYRIYCRKHLLRLLFLFSTLFSVFCFNFICQVGSTRVLSQTLPKLNVSHLAGMENFQVAIISLL